ncbi:hypothetical protein ACFWNK_38310 [Streptomyces sp. NPDC058417]|uniref:hypothetical protein n=1 Tax=unclassified Streptomyces TaxID=2593676 RepID=UPI003662DE30
MRPLNPFGLCPGITARIVRVPWRNPAVTGADIGRLALLRGVDVNETATVVKVHDSPAHRRCRIYPLPYWARPLAHAAGIHRQLQGRAPGSTLLPLIGLRDAEQLRHPAEGIRYRLRPAP